MELNQLEKRRLQLLIEHTLVITGKPVEEFKRDCDNLAIIDAMLDGEPDYQFPESAVETLLPNLVKCIGWRGDIPELVREEQFESLQELKNALTIELD